MLTKQPCLHAYLSGVFLLILPITVTSAPQFTAYVTAKVEDGQPVRRNGLEFFDCSDRIYVVVEASGLSAEEHEMTVRWINPVGEQEERTDYTFLSGSHEPIEPIWAWLQLDGGPGSAIGRMFDSSFGMEDFIGEWEARIYIDGEPMAAPRFNVLC